MRNEIEHIINQSLEQVIRNFLPWESITKKYFSSPQPEMPTIMPEVKKGVTFDDNESESEIESESDDESDAPPPLNISEEAATLDIPEIDAKDDEDPIKELEKKASETLVLNL